MIARHPLVLYHKFDVSLRGLNVINFGVQLVQHAQVQVANWKGTLHCGMFLLKQLHPCAFVTCEVGI